MVNEFVLSRGCVWRAAGSSAGRVHHQDNSTKATCPVAVLEHLHHRKTYYEGGEGMQQQDLCEERKEDKVRTKQGKAVVRYLDILAASSALNTVGTVFPTLTLLFVFVFIFVLFGCWVVFPKY